MKKTLCLILIIFLLSACSPQLVNVEKKLEIQEKVFVIPDNPGRVTFVEGVKVIQLEARQWEFIPNEIVLNQGEKVRIEAYSSDILHGLEIKALGIDEKLEPGTLTKIEFIAETPGTYDFRSSQYSGVGFNNMKGKIIIE
jgi:heme/copper-type cytochrome/quinol oxidase subunit 2